MEHQMNPPTLDDGSKPTTYVYTCWPFGGLVCGIGTMVIGAALLAQWAIPGASDLVWGIALLLFGAFITLWQSRRGSL